MPRLNIIPNIQVSWTPTQYPELFERSTVQYQKMPLESFVTKGFSNEYIEAVLETFPEGTFIAGGYLTSLISGANDPKSDIDIFFKNEESFRQAYVCLTANSNSLPEVLRGYRAQRTIENALTPNVMFINFVAKGKPNIQLIKTRWFSTPEEIIDGFDFTITQFAIDEDNFYFNPESLLDIINKKLTLHKLTFPEKALARIAKYTKKGYSIEESVMEKITEQILRVVREHPNRRVAVRSGDSSSYAENPQTIVVDSITSFSDTHVNDPIPF